jgi:hypothetical protein
MMIVGHKTGFLDTVSLQYVFFLPMIAVVRAMLECAHRTMPVWYILFGCIHMWTLTNINTPYTIYVTHIFVYIVLDTSIINTIPLYIDKWGNLRLLQAAPAFDPLIEQGSAATARRITRLGELPYRPHTHISIDSWCSLMFFQCSSRVSQSVLHIFLKSLKAKKDRAALQHRDCWDSRNLPQRKFPRNARKLNIGKGCLSFSVRESFSTGSPTRPHGIA